MRNVLHQHYLWKHLQLWLLNNGQRQCVHAWIMVCTLTNRHSNHVNANTIQMKQLDPISFLYIYIKYKIIFHANQFFWKLNIRRITPAESFKHLFWKIRISEVTEKIIVFLRPKLDQVILNLLNGLSNMINATLFI